MGIAKVGSLLDQDTDLRTRGLEKAKEVSAQEGGMFQSWGEGGYHYHKLVIIEL